MDLQNKVILVTGASLGIGLATAKMLKAKDAKVIITGRNKERLEKAAAENDLIPIASDVSNEEDVIKLFEEIVTKYGTLDVLVNNAGFGTFEKLENIEADKFNSILQTNVIGAALAAREASKIFVKNNSGAIINIASTAATKGFPGGTAYVASKFALRGMTECWRAELRPHNVRVILINPSEVQTEFFVNAGGERRDYNPTKLMGEDIAHAVVSSLEMNDRGFITELTVFATNPK